MDGKPRLGIEFSRIVRFPLSDLSRNRFTELPDEVTGFLFLETLLLNQNVLRSIPDTVRSLSCLSFLDLRWVSY